MTPCGSSQNNHWGNWVRSRVAFIGFRRHLSFARAVGCGPNRLSEWLQMESPPKLLLKGFDTALCAQLRTDAFTLFTNYANVAPEAAPVLGAQRKPSAPPAPSTREAVAA